MAAVLVLAGLLGPARAAQAASDVSVSGDTVTITVRIDLQGGDAALARRWAGQISDAWNDGPGIGQPFRYCGKKVRFAADIQAGGHRPDATAIDVKHIPRGTGFRDDVYFQDSFNPTRENAVGAWADSEPAWVIAHEFGHVLGIDDEYVEETGKDRDEYAGQGSLMGAGGTGGKVLQRHIDEAANRHRLRERPAPCRYEGVYQVSTHLGAAGGTIDAGTDEMGVVLEEAADGSVTGHASGTFSYLNRGSTCGGDTAKLGPTAARVEFSGRRQGRTEEILQLAVSGQHLDNPVLTISGCGVSVSQPDPALGRGFMFLDDPAVKTTGDRFELDKDLTRPQGRAHEKLVVHPVS